MFVQVTFVVGPAHMMFPNMLNKLLQRDACDLTIVRNTLRKSLPGSVYKLKLTIDDDDVAAGDDEERHCYLLKPPTGSEQYALIGYRYTSPNPLRIGRTERQQLISSTSDGETRPVRHDQFLNDMVLLPLDRQEAESLNTQVRAQPIYRHDRLVDVDNEQRLTKYLAGPGAGPAGNSEIRIMVNNLPGRIVGSTSPIRVAQGEHAAHYFLFQLDGGG